MEQESAARLTATLMRLIEKNIPILCKIWADCGFTEAHIATREQEVHGSMENMLIDMIKEEEDNKHEIIKNIEDNLKKCQELSSELRVTISVEDMETLPLYEVENILKRRVEEFTKIKERLFARFQELRNVERSLCAALGTREICSLSSMPTEAELDAFQQSLDLMKEQKDRLTRIFTETKSMILLIMKELELQPVTDFERKVVLDKDCSFVLSKQNMNRLKDLHVTYERQLEERKELSDKLREKLSNLWERLQEDHQHRDNFLQSCPGYTTSSIEALKQEIRRCEEKKRLNIKQFVKQIREELVEWWDRCRMAEDQRQKFTPFYMDNFTEEVLEQHETEVKKIEGYYMANIDIFALINEHQNLWKKMLEMENREQDKNRLFQNRGGQLLREERERKIIQKKLPTIEEELKKHVASYKQREGSDFLFYGQCVLSMIEHQWMEYKNTKEQEKQARKMVKEHDPAQKTSTRTTSTSKRKLAQSPSTASSHKVRKIDENKPINKANVTRRKVVRGLLQQNFPVPNAANHDDLNISVTSRYTDFQDQLEKLNYESPCSSSLLAGRCLRERNKIENWAAPAAVTPVKPPRKNLPQTPTTNKTPQSNSRFRGVTPQSNSRFRGVTPQSNSRFHGGTPTSASKRFGNTPALSTPRSRPPLII